MPKIFRLFAILTVLTLALSACNLPRATPTSEADAVKTAAVMTVNAFSTQLVTTPGAAQPTAAQPATNMPSANSPTNVPPTAPPPPTVVIPTLPPPPTLAPPPTATPIPCDKLGTVQDITIPDGTVIDPDKTFTKTWRLTNAGSCSWTPSYKLVFDGGSAMGGPASVALTSNVNPGGTIDVSVVLKAPATPNTYQGNWKLQNAAGTRFGWGPNTTNPFWVIIKVEKAPVTFAVTSVTSSANPPAYAGVCPVVITFTANIKANAAGTVTYYWERSDGSKGATKSLTFDSAGTQSVSTTWTLGGAGTNYSGWQRVYIDTPNHQTFGNANFSIACTP